LLPSSETQKYLEFHKIEKDSEEVVKNFIVKCVLNDSKLSKSRMPDLRTDLEATEINY